MRRITKYVLWDLSVIFLLALSGMTLLMVLVGVAQEAIRQGLGPGPILRLIPYVIPNALRFAVPGTMLFAACSVFGRMSAANEIVAVKSLGVSPMAVIQPALVLAFVVSCLAVWLNDIAVSWGREGIHRVVLQSVEQIAYGMLRTHRSYGTDRFSIVVQRVDGQTLVSPTLSFRGAGSEPITLTAREGELRLNPDRNTLSIRLVDAEFDYGEDVRGTFPDTYEYDIPLSLASRKGEMGGGPSELPLWRIREESGRQKIEVQRLEQVAAADSAFELLTGDFAAVLGRTGTDRAAHLAAARTRLHRLHTEKPRRFANGFSCFFFVLVGAPLAIRLRTADVWTTFGICFLPILFVYYPLLAMGVDRAKSGDWPPYSVWLGNVILGVIGCWLIERVKRY